MRHLGINLLCAIAACVRVFSRQSGAGHVVRCGFLLLSLACFDIAPSQAAETSMERIAGDYQLSGVMETASGLRLSADGTYQFFLSYGSADERDEGAWRVDGSDVLLSSTAPATPPAFIFVRSGSEPFPGVRVSFEGEGARAAARLTQGVVIANGREAALNSKSENYMQTGSAAAPVQKVRMVLMGVLREYPVFELEPADPTHNHFVFRVTPGNYGWVRFEGARLRTAGNELHLKTPKMNREFRYVRLKE